ncbi:hypothetical protein MMC13_005677 [Lambiella insularis]|nr:hypothetical protein [Lambiella insularis]
MANAANNGITENPSRSRLHTSEERRALLGCFYLTSVVSTCFKEVDALQYTPYFEECGQALLTRREYQSDIHLVLAGRLQHIVQRIRMSLLYPGSDGIRSFKVPIGVYVKSFSAELEAFKCSIPFELKEDKSLSLQYHHAEIQLYELGLSDPFHGTDNNDYILERLEILYNCLTATKSFIHEYFEVPVTSYHFRTFVIHAQLAHAVIVLSKLTFYDEHPWDTKHVISTLSLMKTLERVSELYEEAEQTTKVNGLPLEADGLFSRWARKVRWLRAWCEPRLPAEAEASAPTTQVPSVLARDDAPLALDDLLAGGLFSDMDELSWQHFMKDWDEGSVNN